MLNVDLETLLVFKTVYETGSCTVASKQHNISNSKVTRCLSTMRDYYRDALFIRKKDGFVPTAKSNEIYFDICEIITLFQKVSLSENQMDIIEECVIAVPPTLSVGLPEYIDLAFPAIAAGTTVNIKPLRNVSCDDLVQGEISLAVIQGENRSIKACLQKHGDEIVTQPIGIGECVYVVAKDTHPIWQQQVNLAEIARFPFVITAIAGFNDRLDPFEALCKDSGMPLQSIHKTHSLAGLIGKLRTSNSISFLGTRCAAEFASSMTDMRVQKMDNEDYQQLHSIVNKPNYSLVYKAERARSFPDGFCQMLAHFISQQIAE